MKINRMLPDVNSSSECIELLEHLDKAIGVLYCLTDDYYTDQIWNGSSDLINKLNRLGLNDEFFMETADKLETLFALLAFEGYSNSILISKMREEEPEEGK